MIGLVPQVMNMGHPDLFRVVFSTVNTWGI